MRKSLIFVILINALLVLVVLSGCAIIAQGPKVTPKKGDTAYEMLWNYQAGTSGSGVDSISVSSDGSYVALKADFDVYFYDKEGWLLWRHNENEFGQDSRFGQVSVSSDGSYVASSANLFDREGKLLWRQKYRPDLVSGIPALSADGSYTAVGWCGSSTSEGKLGTVGKYVYLYNREGKLLWSYEAGDAVYSVSISADGSYIAGASFDNNVYFFNRDGRLLWSYQTGAEVYSVSVSADGSSIAAGGRDGKTYLFNRDGKLLWSNETDYGVKTALVTSDGSYVAALSIGNLLYFFDREGKLLWRGGEARYLWRKGGSLASVAITPDGAYIVAGSGEGYVYVYNREGRLLWSFDTKVNYRIDAIAISIDGSYIAAGSRATGPNTGGKVFFFGRSSDGKGSKSTPTLSTSQPQTPGWETHTYQNKEAGFAFSFATPAEWQATGPIGKRQIGGWYDPKYPKSPDPAAVWVYWITTSPPSSEVPGDPIILVPTQKRVATRQAQGNWSYHLVCVAPLEIFDQQAHVFNQIMASLKPLR